MRELLQQFTEAFTNDRGNFVTSVIVHPFVMNGAARGYRLVERQDKGAAKAPPCMTELF